MRKSYLSAALAAPLLAFVATSIVWVGLGGKADAQQPGPRMQAAPSVVLVDVPFIFKNHERLKSQVEGLRTEMTRVEEDFKHRSDALKAEAENSQHLGLTPGSPEFKQKEEELNAKGMKLQLDVKAARSDFAQRESKMYYQTYLEVQDALRYFCQQHDISVVLNTSREKVNPDIPSSVARQLNQQVIFSRQDLDITDVILTEVNRRPAGPAANSAYGPTGFTPASGFQR